MILINDDPIIGYVDDFLNEDECKLIIEHAEPSFAPSTVMGVNSEEFDSRRSSSNTWLDHANLPELQKTVQRISDFIRIPMSHAESMCVLRYELGQEYQPHYDGFSLNTPNGISACRYGHQRIFTVLMYLNTPVLGGETVFPNIDATLNAVKGRVVFFGNIGNALDDLPHQTLHGSNPVKVGKKYAATLWYRIRPRHEQYHFPCDPPELYHEWTQ